MKMPAKEPARRARPFWLALAIFAALLLVAFLWKPGQPPVESEIPSSPADQERGLRAEQLQAAEKLVAAFPQSDDAVYLLGLTHNEQGDSATAVKCWEHSLELDGTRADAHDSLGHAFLLRDDYDKAEASFRKALEIDPTLATANFRLANTLVHQGKMREAAAILEKAHSLSAEGHRLLGEAHQHLKEFEKSKTSFEAAIHANSNLAEAYYGLSKVLRQLGDEEKSRDCWAKFSALKAQKDEQARDVRSTYDSLSITKRSVAQTITDVGRVYVINKRPHDAEALWLRAAALDPANTLCRLQLAVHYHQTGQLSRALQYYQEVARADPSDALVQLNMGHICLKLNQLTLAEEAFQKVVQLAPERPEGHAALAQVRAQRK
jgi:protein O-GlcNAc transferase